VCLKLCVRVIEKWVYFVLGLVLLKKTFSCEFYRSGYYRNWVSCGIFTFTEKSHVFLFKIIFSTIYIHWNIWSDEIYVLEVVFKHISNIKLKENSCSYCALYSNLNYCSMSDILHPLESHDLRAYCF
jgi:hypothetical protein